MANPRQVGGYNFHPQFASDRDALIRAMYAEAGNQSPEGQAKVGYNIRNRADAGYLGKNSIQDTILAQNKSGRGGQYSSFLANRPQTNIAGRNAMRLDPNGSEYQKLGGIADEVLGRVAPDPTMGASHYYAPGGMPGGRAPRWANSPNMDYLGREGAHKFYQEKGFNPQQPDTPMRMGDQTMLAGNTAPDASRFNAFQTAMATGVPNSPAPIQVAMNAPDNNMQNTGLGGPIAPSPPRRDVPAYAPVPPVKPEFLPNQSPLQNQTPPVRPVQFANNAPSSAEFLRDNYGGNSLPMSPDPIMQSAPIMAPPPSQMGGQNDPRIMAQLLQQQQFDPFGSFGTQGGDGFGMGGTFDFGSLFG